MKRVFAVLALVAAFTPTTMHAQSTENVEVEIKLSAAQLRFVGACHNAGYESPNDYGDCVRAVPLTGDSCDTTETCELYERWLAACQATWAQFLDREATLTDFGFYAEVCGGYKPGS